MTTDLPLFFEKISHIIDNSSIKKQESIQRGEHFNIMQIAGLENSELFHSSFIAEMLSPIGSHGQDSLFLKLFLTEIPEINEHLTRPFDDSTASVQTEYVTSEGRIDILIKNSLGQAIIIENKIYAAEQPDQIKRYQKYASEVFGTGNYVVLYLTLYGSDSDTVDDGDTYLPISYQQNILQWINSSISNSSRLPGAREVLIQYEYIINLLTNRIMETVDKNAILDMLIDEPEVAKAIYSLQSEYVIKSVSDYLMPQLEELCAKENIELKGAEDFVKSMSQIYVGFTMTPKSWQTYELSLECDSRYWGTICIGVHRKDCNEKGEKCKQFKCLPKVNDLWCGGWKELPGKFSHLSYDTVPEIIHGEFAEEIMKIVRQISDEAIQCGYLM